MIVTGTWKRYGVVKVDVQNERFSFTGNGFPIDMYVRSVEAPVERGQGFVTLLGWGVRRDGTESRQRRTTVIHESYLPASVRDALRDTRTGDSDA